jgi:peptidoglycan/xylan/chitin deacetylase (PgdA/CDA1 family)
VLPVILLALAVTQSAPTAEIRKDLRTRTPILTYHDVIERRRPGSLWFDCTVSELEVQLKWLKKQGATFVSLDDLYSHLTQGSGLPPKAIAITFADNYAGFYRLGAPVLRKYRVPVTMFVHTGFVGSTQGRPKMTWKQLTELSAEGWFSVGSQTVSHPGDLRTLSDSQLQKEFKDSKAKLQSKLRADVPYIAYPNGKWDDRARTFARLAGYRMAFTEVTRPAETSPSIFAVSRYVHTKYRQAWADAYGRRRH